MAYLLGFSSFTIKVVFQSVDCIQIKCIKHCSLTVFKLLHHLSTAAFALSPPGLVDRQLNQTLNNSYTSLDALREKVCKNICGESSPSLPGRINHMRQPL